MPYGTLCGPCRMIWFLLIILALIFMYGTMYKYNIETGTYNDTTLSDNLSAQYFCAMIILNLIYLYIAHIYGVIYGLVIYC